MLSTMIYYTIAFLSLFCMGEWLYHKKKWSGERTRKLIHISVGLLALSFPVFFEAFWPVAILCTSFLALLILSIKFGFLKSINDINRYSYGSLLFPVMVMICFAISLWTEQWVYFYLPILILAICDPVAAYFGKKYGKSVIGFGKSKAGFVAFLISAFLLTLLLTLSFKYPIGEALILAVLMAMATAVAEFFTKNGWDNFSIPLSAITVMAVFNNLLFH